MRQGIVKKYKNAENSKGNGYGFILDDESGEQVFFHFSQVNGSVTEGDAVTFEMGKNNKGPCAVIVSKA